MSGAKCGASLAANADPGFRCAPSGLCSLLTMRAERVWRVLGLFHSGKLHRSRGADRARGLGLWPSPKKARRTARQGAQPVLMCTRTFWARVAPLGAPSRRSPSAPGRAFQPRPTGRRPSASSSQAARSGRRAEPRRRPSARLAGRARGRRPEPHERCNRFASPHGVGRDGIKS